jgi:ornithine decarboxylase
MKELFRAEIVREVASYVQRIPLRSLLDAHGSPLLLLDREKVRAQYQALQTALPMVQHHFAIKALRDPVAIAAVDECGGYFDVMTNSDVDMIRAGGISPERCVHTNPIKKPEDITHGLTAGIRTFVVDNPAEIDKFSAYSDEVQLLIRLSFRNPDAKSDLSYKFGVPPAEADQLVRYALAKNLQVAGFSLHVGSQIHATQAYVHAINETITLIDEIERTHRIRFEVLNIGGGFPVDYVEPMPSLKEIAQAISPLLGSLAQRFKILSEPGRFVAASAMTLITQVVGKSIREGRPWYYVDDGLYGSYSNVMFENVTPPIIALKELDDNWTHTLSSAVLAGPTCDSVDVITTDCLLPSLEIGDFLVSPMMGAYTTVSSTEYNGIERTPIAVL